MVISPTTSLGAAVCRICHCGETSITSRGARGGGEPLISPCHCRGTMGLYHRSCVERWLLVSGKTDCEICNFKFQIKRKNRSIWELFKADWCYFVMITILHVILHTVLHPLTICLFYICARAGLFHREGTGRDAKGFFGSMLVWLMGFFLAIAYLVWICGLLTFYGSSYHAWRAKNQVIHVVDQLSPDESLHFNPYRMSLPMQWIKRLKSFGRDLTRRGRRGDADVSVIYIPQQVMEDVERTAGSGGENRGRFTVTPVNAAAGRNMEFQSNLHAEISPIAVCSQPAPSSSSAVPCPLVTEKHPYPPSTVSSFSCSPDLNSGANSAANNGRSSANCPARCLLIVSTVTLPRGAMSAPSLTSSCVTAGSSATRSNAAASPSENATLKEEMDL